jgi:pilus assembly protein CpaB
MTVPRRVLLVIAVVAGLGAGGIYHANSQRAAIVVAARDIDAARPLVADDVVLRSFPADGVPDGAFSDVAAIVGKRPRAPLFTGQLILAAGLAAEAATFSSGLTPPSGTRAIAVPAGPAQALGGAITPGSRVDLISVPVVGRAPAGRTTELLAVAALVLDVRTETGSPFVRTATKTVVGQGLERLGSVVLAIPVREELAVADRIATSTFVFVLSSARS